MNGNNIECAIFKDLVFQSEVINKIWWSYRTHNCSKNMCSCWRSIWPKMLYSIGVKHGVIKRKRHRGYLLSAQIYDGSEGSLRDRKHSRIKKKYFNENYLLQMVVKNQKLQRICRSHRKVRLWGTESSRTASGFISHTKRTYCIYLPAATTLEGNSVLLLLTCRF